MRPLVTKIVIAIFALLLPNNLYARTIDPLFVTTSLIVGLKSGQEHLKATGFFYSDEQGKLYVVTNKHVIYGDRFAENPPPVLDQIRLKLHTDLRNLSQNKEITIDLLDGQKRLWLEYKTDPAVDIVLIPLTISRKDYSFASANKSFIESENIQVGFEKIFIMGYPFGWYDEVNNLPITRVGHLSSPFKVPFRGKPVMLGDIETHKGMSGSPVFMRLDNYTEKENDKLVKRLGQSRTILIGIYSGQPLWLIENKKTGKIIPIHHTLANIWFSELILEILK